MSTDKRSVFTDALETLGTIIDDTQKRDAIHLAVEPVVAKQSLFPGDHVTSDGRKCDAYSNEAVGIVDPFLYTQPYSKTEKESSYYACVLAGQRFWLVLYPRTIKSLRHVWEHPAFPPSELSNVSETSKESEIEKSKKWVEDFVKKCQEIENGIDYEYIKKESLNYKSLMAFADDWVESKEEYPDYFYVSDNLRDEGLPDAFWDHYQIITGKKVEEKKRESFFTCAC